VIANDRQCSRFQRGSANDRNRRVSPIAAPPDDGLLSGPKAGTQPRRREPLFVPFAATRCDQRRRPMMHLCDIRSTPFSRTLAMSPLGQTEKDSVRARLVGIDLNSRPSTAVRAPPTLVALGPLGRLEVFPCPSDPLCRGLADRPGLQSVYLRTRRDLGRRDRSVQSAAPPRPPASATGWASLSRGRAT
jgi:hypothetical protein